MAARLPPRPNSWKRCIRASRSSLPDTTIPSGILALTFSIACSKRTSPRSAPIYSALPRFIWTGKRSAPSCMARELLVPGTSRTNRGIIELLILRCISPIFLDHQSRLRCLVGAYAQHDAANSRQHILRSVESCLQALDPVRLQQSAHHQGFGFFLGIEHLLQFV